MIQVIKDIFGYTSGCPSVVTIGKFDGLHLGHQALVGAVTGYAKSRTEKNLQTVLFSFDMAQVYLLTHHERRALLEKSGIDAVVECPFGPKIITMEAEDFVRDVLVGRLHAAHVVVGPDFRFGYGRRGSAALLKTLGNKLGFTVEVVPEVEYQGQKISSSAVRAAVSQGDMERANAMLGYSFFVTGEVIHGRQLGRTIGVPTTNLIPGRKKLLPPNGVYCTVSVIGGRRYRGVTDIGDKPTVDGQFVGVETYLFDFDGDVYGENQKVEVLHFLRPERKFPSVEALREQIGRDHEAGKEFFSRLDENS